MFPVTSLPPVRRSQLVLTTTPGINVDLLIKLSNLQFGLQHRPTGISFPAQYALHQLAALYKSHQCPLTFQMYKVLQLNLRCWRNN